MYKEIYDNETNHWWFRGRRKIVSRVLNEWIKPPVDRALDVGFATGTNIELIIKPLAKEIWGIDPSEEAVKFASEKNPDIKIIKGYFPEDINNDSKFDLIVMLDSLEHIKDDQAAVKKIGELLNNNGLAIITVPAFSFLWSQHDELLHHHRRYTRRDLKKLIDNIPDLKIKKLSYFNFVLFPLIVLFRFLRKIFGLGVGKSDNFMPSPAINKLLEFLFSIEAGLINYLSFPLGVSLLCVLRKESLTT